MHIMPTQSVPWPLLLHWPCNRTHTALLLAGSTTHNGPLILNPSAVTTQADRIALIQPAFSIISWDVCPWGRIEEGNLTLWGCVFVSGRENKLRGAFQAIQEYGDLCIGEMVSWAYTKWDILRWRAFFYGRVTIWRIWMVYLRTIIVIVAWFQLSFEL
jgi:hypothetical protein